MRGQCKHFKTLLAVCCLVILLEYLIFSWTYNSGSYQSTRQPDKGIEYLPRDSIQHSAQYTGTNRTSQGLLIFKQIVPPRILGRNSDHTKGKNMSVHANAKSKGQHQEPNKNESMNKKKS